MELARAGKQVWLSGRDVGRIPADKLGRLFGGGPYWWLISRVMSVRTPLRKKILETGVESTPRISGIQSGRMAPFP